MSSKRLKARKTVGDWEYHLEKHGSAYYLARVSAKNPAKKQFVFKKPGSRSGATLVKYPWRYVVKKQGSRIYIREIGAEPGRGHKALVPARGRTLRFKPGSALGDKLTQAFASAVRSAP